MYSKEINYLNYFFIKLTS